MTLVCQENQQPPGPSRSNSIEQCLSCESTSILQFADCKLLLVSVQLLVALHVALPWPKHVLLVHYLHIYCTMYDIPVPLLVYQAAHIAAHLPVPVPVLAGLPPTTPLECILHRHPCRGRWPWSGAPRQRPPPRPSPPPRGSSTSFAMTSCPQSYPLANTVMLKVGLAFVL